MVWATALPLLFQNAGSSVLQEALNAAQRWGRGKRSRTVAHTSILSCHSCSPFLLCNFDRGFFQGPRKAHTGQGITHATCVARAVLSPPCPSHRPSFCAEALESCRRHETSLQVPSSSPAMASPLCPQYPHCHCTAEKSAVTPTVLWYPPDVHTPNPPCLEA